MNTAHPPHALLRPQILIPFVVVSLIWGSTWFAIKDQLDAAPPAWSIAWRFYLAAAGLFVLARLRGEPLGLARNGHNIAFWIAVTQFAFNYNLVYQAEIYLTSGVVAELYALMIPINAVLGSRLLGQPVSRGFIAGGMIGLAGTALLAVHEARMADLGGHVWLGLGFTMIGIVSACTANIIQALPTARHYSTVTLLAWAMLYGALLDTCIALVLAGPPVLPLEMRYLGGLAYLAIFGSVITFPLYFHLIREIGPGPAAYINAVVPVVAMVFSTLFEGYRWSLLAAGGSALALLGLIVALRARSPSR